ncbi:hypothetical protein MAH1_13020 [Sessilibacter sp. MAH1]
MLNPTENQSLVKACTSSHSLSGLFVAAILYLVCISGTVAVFHSEIGRWEQPLAPEGNIASIEQVEASLNRYLDENTELSDHEYVFFPSDASPRYKIGNKKDSWYLDSEGEFAQSAAAPYAEFLTRLHTSLLLPESFALYVVSITGVFLAALIISGILSHPSIIRDAFKWRKNNSERIYQVDIHNRLSVWGLPFYLMIAMTGVYFGFVGLLFAAYAEFAHNGDRAGLLEEIYGAEPQLTQQLGHVEFANAYRQVEAMNPGGKPLFAILHEAGTDKQFLDFFVQQPERLLYSETFRFSIQGEFISTGDYIDGAVGKQIAYSTYRLHFGDFAGLSVKIIYALLGLSLTVICVSGVNIWLLKRKHETFVNPLWTSLVWGTPAVMLLCGSLSLLLKNPTAFWFWLPLAFLLVASVWVKNTQALKTQLLVLNAILTLVLLIVYVVSFGSSILASAAIGGELFLMALMIWFGVMAYRSFKLQRSCINPAELTPVFVQ